MSLEPKPATDASLGQLMSEFSSQTSRLVRDEMRLAQKEFQESAKHAGIGAGLLSVAGLLAVFGFAAIVAAAVAALSLALPVWAAALIVAALLLLAAGVAGLLRKGQVQRTSSATQQSVSNLNRDI